jgi:hypothetical protein
MVGFYGIFIFPSVIFIKRFFKAGYAGTVSGETEREERTMSIGQHITGPIGYIVAKTRKRDRTDTILKAVFLSLQLVDLGLTLWAARSGWPELNPYMKASLGSMYKLAIFKFGIPVLISWFVPGRWLIPAILLLCGVVGWNVKELLCLVFC